MRFATIVILLVATAATAQTRPSPQAPPRRNSPPPRTAPPPKRDAPEPSEPKTTTPPPQQPQATTATTAPADGGAALYRKNGCYECHANEAQGGPQGPRIGPNPIPMPRFMAYVRNPSGDMPPFTAKVISDQDLASIYAFLQSRPTPPPVKDIPLLTP